MRKALTTCAIIIVSLATSAAAGEYTIRPAYPDLNPGDGQFEGGSWFNPYVIEDRQSGRTWQVRPSYPDLNPGDGLFEEGSWSNPYRLEGERLE